MTQYKWISVTWSFQFHHWSYATNRPPALHKPSMCWYTCVGHSCSTISPRRWVVFSSSIASARHRVMPPLLSKRSTLHPTCRGSTVSLTCLPGHRRLRARATVRMMPISIRKGSQVFRKPAQLGRGETDEGRWGECWGDDMHIVLMTPCTNNPPRPLAVTVTSTGYIHTFLAFWSP